jgi:hypothetical protein
MQPDIYCHICKIYILRGWDGEMLNPCEHWTSKDNEK